MALLFPFKFCNTRQGWRGEGYAPFLFHLRFGQFVLFNFNHEKVQQRKSKDPSFTEISVDQIAFTSYCP